MTREEAIELAKKHAGKNLQLVYVDYQDCLSNTQVSQFLCGELEKLDEGLADWAGLVAFDSIGSSIEEIEKSIGQELDDKAKEIIADTLYELDTSDPLTDLLRNTQSMFFYYDLGVGIEGESWSSSETREGNVKSILRTMRVSKKSPKYERCLEVAQELVDNASYGGELVILFSCKPRDLSPAEKYLKFTQPHLCIMDRIQGSGMDSEWPEDVAVVYDGAKLFVDTEAPGYSYSRDVCGLLVRPYENGSMGKKVKGWKLLNAGENPSMKAEMAREAELERRWKKEKKCTLGDMPYVRHPSEKMRYSNDFPAGTTCGVCHTFWVD